MILKANPKERLVDAAEPRTARARRRFIGLVVLCAALHALILLLLIFESGRDTIEIAQETEIPIELVPEVPPEPQPEPPAPPQPPQPQKKEPPPKQKAIPEEMKPAFDAPRDANKETIEREAPDKQTRSPNAAPPSKQTAVKPTPRSAPAQVEETAPDPSPQHAPEKVVEEKLEDKPDAEAVDKAEKEPAKSKDRQAKRDPVKTPPSQGNKSSVAEQLAALSPAPSYSVGSAAKSAPVGGGTEKSTYLSILYGLIMRQWRDPAGSTARALTAEGIVVFYVDEVGNLTHQALYRTSGRPDLDAAAANAVRRAAPFPAPPRGMPRTIIFQYGTR